MVTFVAPALQNNSVSGDLHAGRWEAALARASQGPLAGKSSVTVVIVEHFRIK